MPRNSLRAALCLYLVAMAPCAAKEAERIGCGQLEHSPRSVFTLSVRLEIAHTTDSYELCAPDRFGGPAQVLVLKSEFRGRKPQTQSSRVALDNASYEQLLTLLKRALKFNLEDDVLGVDGTTTCLETYRSYSLKVCFWSIDYRAEERGVSGLLALQSRLMTLSRKQ